MCGVKTLTRVKSWFRNKGSVFETNALCYGGVCVAGQQEQHHVPHDLYKCFSDNLQEYTHTYSYL
jgi:hypothetical protein